MTQARASARRTDSRERDVSRENMETSSSSCLDRLPTRNPAQHALGCTGSVQGYRMAVSPGSTAHERGLKLAAQVVEDVQEVFCGQEGVRLALPWGRGTRTGNQTAVCREEGER